MQTEMVAAEPVPGDADLIRRGRTPVAPVRPVARWRVGVGLAAVVAVAAGVVSVVRASEGWAMHGLIAFCLGLVLVPLVASPIEWFVHRFLYHEPVVRGLRSIFVVHTAHHFAFFPTHRYVTGGPARRLAVRRRAPDIRTTRVGNARVRMAHFSWYMSFGAMLIWVPAWLATHDRAFVVGLVIASAWVSNLFIVVHDTIHRPGSHRIVEAQPWFAFLDRHHYIHHIDLGANLNFLLPLADWLFGTLRTQLTDTELAGHGTLRDAKTCLVGYGERVTSLALTPDA